MSREAFTWIEIDVDGCALTFGQGACPATLGGSVSHKCFELYDTCPVKAAFVHKKVWRTLRYCQPRSSLPKGRTWYPVMQGQPQESSATVNIAGSDPDLSAFGRRATIKVTLTDFRDHDRYLDPYQAERVSGAAQANGIGYPPFDRGTHFGRLKARWPYYSGRPMRRCSGYIENGAITDVSVTHYVITNMAGPDSRGNVAVEGEDVLNLADNDKTRFPAASNGKLIAPIGDGLQSLTLTPTGVGNAEYPASGRARIGSELVDYTRVGDVVTLTARGRNRTEPSSHNALDTFQHVERFVRSRVDVALRRILLGVGVPASFIPTAEWAAEVSRWLPSTLLDRDLTEPTGAKTLISTMVPLGFSLFWDAKAQLIRLKANRPVDGDPVWVISDNTNIQEVSLSEDDKKRAAAVLFWTVQKDPTKSATSSENYARTWASGDPSVYEPWRYGGGAVKNYFCPWLDDGNDGIVNVAAGRLFKRFETTPKTVSAVLDAVKFAGLKLTDVIMVKTFGLQDVTGLDVYRQYQAISLNEISAGQKIEVQMQSYQFSGRFAYAVPNGTPTYMSATPAQRDPGMFAADPVTLLMPNGDPPYEAI